MVMNACMAFSGVHGVWMVYWMGQSFCECRDELLKPHIPHKWRMPRISWRIDATYIMKPWSLIPRYVFLSFCNSNDSHLTHEQVICEVLIRGNKASLLNVPGHVVEHDT
jgi:hypothetical protein